MNLFQVQPHPETFSWPARPRAIAFVQLGDLVEMVFRSKQVHFAACEFCQTVNHDSDPRCRTCGGLLPPRDVRDTEAAADSIALEPLRFVRPGSAPTPLRNVLKLAILPPLLLFAAFALWHAARTPAPRQQPNAPLATLSPSGPAASAARRAAAPPAHLAPAAASMATATAYGAPASAWAEPRTGQSEIALSLPGVPASAGSAEDSAPLTPAERAPASRARRAAPQAAAAPAGRDPLAACSGSNFFSRAICINTRCADPKLEQTSQCREARRQRQIDEARRNPTLMG